MLINVYDLTNFNLPLAGELRKIAKKTINVTFDISPIKNCDKMFAN